MLWAILRDHHILISLSMNPIGHLCDNYINDLTSPTSLNHITRSQNIMFPNAHISLESLDQKKNNDPIWTINMNSFLTPISLFKTNASPLELSH
jgi:hypothetical protein